VDDSRCDTTGLNPPLQVLLSCSGDKTLKLWSVQDGSCLRTLEGHTASVLRAAWATAGTQVCSMLMMANGSSLQTVHPPLAQVSHYGRGTNLVMIHVICFTHLLTQLFIPPETVGCVSSCRVARFSTARHWSDSRFTGLACSQILSAPDQKSKYCLFHHVY